MKGGILFADGAVYNGDFNNLGPRVGITYQVNERMLLRGGYGRTYLSGSRIAARPPRATRARRPTIRR